MASAACLSPEFPSSIKRTVPTVTPVSEPSVMEVCEAVTAPESVVAVKAVWPKAESARPKKTARERRILFMIRLAPCHSASAVLCAQIAKAVAHIQAVGHFAVKLVPSLDIGE